MILGRLFFTILVTTLTVGCVNFDHKISMTDLADPVSRYVVDQTEPDDYPGHMAAEANIYSCRFGIHHQSADEFDPPKAKIFASLLASYIPGITERRVVLRRFDVYHNERLKVLNKAGKGFGGAVGIAVAQVGNVNEDVFTFKKLQIDTNPGSVVRAEENMVGCDKAREGEYYASEISGGHNVVVTWLQFDVDESAYHFRTFYQFQPQDRAAVAVGISEAIRMSIEGVASRVAADRP